MVQASQNGRSLNLVGRSVWRWPGARIELGWYMLPVTLMRSQMIVERDVFPRRPLQLLLVQDKHVIQALSFQAAHEPLTNGIGYFLTTSMVSWGIRGFCLVLRDLPRQYRRNRARCQRRRMSG